MLYYFLAWSDNYYIVVTMYLDYCLWADNGTHSTACTVGVAYLGGEVTVFVGVIRDDDAILRTYCYTQAATFAPFGINYYFASHLSISY